jgi:outer membrane autotransporter protein
MSHADVKSYHALGYLGGSLGQVKLRAGIGYSHADIDTRRVIDFPGYTDQLNARYHATTWQGFGELGYSLPVGTGTIEPFANAAVVRVSTDNVAERGGVAALSVRDAD